jgi:alpha,alpha-trehalose-phosphate synthase [UDP-forming]
MNGMPTIDRETAAERVVRALRRAAARPRSPRGFEEQTRQEDLERLVRHYCEGVQIVIASNREPYQHVRGELGIEAIRSPGGLASALDSVARATGGLWVAQASGEADRETADAEGRVAVPPGDPRYSLQRIWIEPEEWAQEYNRFANGCLWPLCHIVYIRPHFVESQWHAYQEVNAQFADAILRAIGSQPTLVLLQDYHLALCAARLREKRPDLTIVLFWHIPWPNPEVFRILPWRREILEGLLACDLLGFHIPYHAMNFLDTVAREMEAHIDRERDAVRRRRHRTFVRSYPVSPDAAEISRAAGEPWAIEAAEKLRDTLRLGNARVVLGVDRLDYTKGVPERLAAYERFLESHPEEQGRVAFIQIGVPTRVDLEEYQTLFQTVTARVDALNERFSVDGRPVIHLITRNLDFRELIPYYVLADVMAVTSLHDGMNLVAKEYVAARVGLDGVLILSPFTGASRELEHAIQVSPYDTEALARALTRALHLPDEERAQRMRELREVVRAQNIYDWAQRIFRDARRLHLMPGARRPPARV